MRTALRLALAAAAVALAALTAPSPASAAVTYTVDPNHSEIGFRVRHFMSKVRGEFGGVSGTIVRDDDNPAASSVELTIDAATVDTGNERRDADLRSANFFDVATHPTITFRSTRVEKKGERLYEVTGVLTLHGVEKTLTLPVEFSGEMGDGRGGFRAGFTTETVLDRKEFGITWNQVLDSGGLMLGDEVEVEISVAAVRR